MQTPIEKEINEEYKRQLSEKPVPFIPSSLWYDSCFTCLMSMSTMSIGMSAKDFSVLQIRVGGNKPLNCYEFGGLNNKINDSSAKDLSLTMSTFITLQLEVDDLAAQWNNYTEELRLRIVDEVVKKYQPVSN